MNQSIRMFIAAVVSAASTLLFMGACTSDTTPQPKEPVTTTTTTVKEETLNEMCVRLITDLYEKHNLEFTKPDKSKGCEEFFVEEGISTKAQLQIYIRQLDAELTTLSEPVVTVDNLPDPECTAYAEKQTRLNPGQVWTGTVNSAGSCELRVGE